MKVAQIWLAKISFGPSGSFESRMAMTRSRLAASTHAPLPLLITSRDKLPHLEVNVPGKPMPPQRIYAQADWFFWPHAERIAACDDLITATGAIVQALAAGSEAPSARATPIRPEQTETNHG